MCIPLKNLGPGQGFFRICQLQSIQLLHFLVTHVFSTFTLRLRYVKILKN